MNMINVCVGSMVYNAQAYLAARRAMDVSGIYEH